MKKEFEVKARTEELEALANDPLELVVKGLVYKKAMDIDKAMAVYIKPKAWWVPTFLYKAIIKDHVLLVDKVHKRDEVVQDMVDEAFNK